MVLPYGKQKDAAIRHPLVLPFQLFAETETCTLSLATTAGILSCNTDMTVLSEKFANASVTNEDGVWYCTLTIAEGGEAV